MYAVISERPKVLPVAQTRPAGRCGSASRPERSHDTVAGGSSSRGRGVGNRDADGNIIATYRHTLHQALSDSATFELTQTCIFDTLHKAKPCAPEVGAFID